jgi:mono/diheme cytochrome c family protein
MPPIDLGATEVEAAVEFLSRQRLAAPADDVAIWREVCARCHGLDGRGRTAVAPYLGRRPRDLSSTAFFRGVEPTRLAESLNHGVPGTPMAPWGEALPTFGGTRVIGFLSKQLHDNAMPSPRRRKVARRPEDLSREAIDQAESVFRVECSSCHGPEGRGDGPEAAGLRPAPRDLGNGAFIAGLADRRIFGSIYYGAVGSEMPDHIEGNTPETIWALVDRVREIAGEPLTGRYDDDRWPWQRNAQKGRRPPPRKQAPTSRLPDEPAADDPMF